MDRARGGVGLGLDGDARLRDGRLGAAAGLAGAGRGSHGWDGLARRYASVHLLVVGVVFPRRQSYRAARLCVCLMPLPLGEKEDLSVILPKKNRPSHEG